MKKIVVGKKYAALVDDDDYLTLNQYTWHAHKSSSKKIYAARYAKLPNGKRIKILMHNDILGIKNIDHSDRDTLNNQKYNLRIATASQNQANTDKRPNCSSVYKGVYWHKRNNRWYSYIRFKGKAINIGYFDSEQAAARAYDVKAKELFGDFAKLNFK